MAGIQSAEAPRGKRARKVLSHLEIHPRMGGGHIVKHVYSSYEHQPKDVHFNEAGKSQGGEHIQAHITKHAGLPGGGDGSPEPEPEAEEAE